MRKWARLLQDDGVTLIELLITLIVLSIAFLVILGGMTTAVVLSDLHRRQAKSETIVRQFAEAIKASSYENCGTTSSYALVYSSPDTRFTTSVTEVKIWSGTAFVSADVTPGCPTSIDSGIQLITLRVDLQSSRGIEEVSIVKRRPQ
jgi:prepilin-type N-terminal cleavage/methylation domain-containing protein